MKKSGLVIAVLLIFALGFLAWFTFRDNGYKSVATDRHGIVDTLAGDSAGLGFGVPDANLSSASNRNSKASGATMVSYAPAPSFADRDIHEVPLGTILDYAVGVVQYDPNRARGTSLPKNQSGQSPFVTVTPAEGVWGMTRGVMGEGHIVAKIQSDGDYSDLGLAGGLNFLWVGSGRDGELEWVVVPGTAFAPLKDLKESEIKRIFNQHAEVASRTIATRDF